MANLSEIKKDSNWGDTASTLNSNFQNINVDLEKVKSSTTKFKGYFTTETALKNAYPSPKVGETAWVGEPYPGTVYDVQTDGTWHNTETAPDTDSVDLTDYARKEELTELQEKIGEGGNTILTWNEDNKNTRLQVVSELRKKGLIVTYVNNNGYIINEQYASENIDEESWGLNENWTSGISNIEDEENNRDLLINGSLEYIQGVYLKSNGELGKFSTGKVCPAFIVKEDDEITYSGKHTGASIPWIFWDKLGNIIEIGEVNTYTKYKITIPADAYIFQAGATSGFDLQFSSSDDQINTYLNELDNRTFANTYGETLTQGLSTQKGDSGLQGNGFIIAYDYGSDSDLYMDYLLLNSDHDFVNSPISLRILLCSNTEEGVRLDWEMKVTTSSNKIKIGKQFNSNQMWAVMYLNGAASISTYIRKGNYNVLSIKSTSFEVGDIITTSEVSFSMMTTEVWNYYPYSYRKPINEAVENLYSKSNSYTLTPSNSDVLYLTGSSLAESIYTPAGLSWAQRCSDIVDLPIVNGAKSGSTRTDNIFDLANNKTLNLQQLVSSWDVNKTYILWTNSANGTKMGGDGKKELLVAKRLTEKFGAEMLLGTEEPWDDGASQLIRSFANENRVIYHDTRYYIERNYKNYPAGLINARHGGWRVVCSYMSILDILKGLSINQSIKLFLPRKKQSQELQDLLYNTTEQRLRKYTSLSVGCKTTYIKNMKGADNCDKYDTEEYFIPNDDGSFDNVSSESLAAKFYANQKIEVTGYILIECILNVCQLRDFEFSFLSSLSPTNIYILKYPSGDKSETANSYDIEDDTISSWEEVSFTFADGACSFSLMDTSRLLSYDKISILVNFSTNTNISNIQAKYSGLDKKAYKKIIKRQFGNNIYDDTGFNNSDWNLNGNAEIVSYPSGLDRYPTANDGKKVLVLKDNDAYITRSIKINGKKIAVKILCQNFFKYMTTRYSDTSEYDDFVERENAQIGYTDYDYGSILITLNDLYVKKKIVYPGWNEVYVIFDTEGISGDFTIKIKRDNWISGVYNSDSTPIHIYDVQVQEF